MDSEVELSLRNKLIRKTDRSKYFLGKQLDCDRHFRTTYFLRFLLAPNRHVNDAYF